MILMFGEFLKEITQEMKITITLMIVYMFLFYLLKKQICSS